MRTLWCVLAAAVVVAPLGAQSKPDTLKKNESASPPRTFSFGASVGTMSFGSGGYERALSAAIGVALPHGFSLSINPTYANAQGAPSTDTATGRRIKPKPVSGLADLPVSIGYTHAFSGDWSPGFDVSLDATLPTGDTTAVGSGRTSFGASLGVWFEPVDGWSVSVGAGHALTNDYASALGAIAPTSVSLGTSHDIGPVSFNFGYSTELGAMPTGTTHSQSFEGGMSIPLGGDLSLTADGSTGRVDGASSYAFSIGIGTTFASVNEVNPFTAARRLANAFGKGRSLGKSRSPGAAAAGKKKKKKP